jgi:tetratricopeptide (TPR) repeat protein
VSSKRFASRGWRTIGTLLGSALAIAGLVIAVTSGVPWWFFVAALALTFLVGSGLLDRIWFYQGLPLRRIYRPRIDAPSTSFLVPTELPLPASPFVGRKSELATIIEFLKSGPLHGPRIVVINGPAGIGKTALALQCGHAVSAAYPHGQLFASQTNDSNYIGTSAFALESFIDALQGQDESIPEDPSECRKRYLELTCGRQVLIVLDDARDQSEIWQALPASHSCSVIVTSRAPIDLAKDQLNIGLEPLSEEDALSLLDAMVGGNRVRQDMDAAQQIIEDSRGYPIAVRLTGASLATRPYWGLGRIALRLDEEKQLFADPRAGKSLPGLLDMSYVMLTEDERRALRLLGLIEEPAFEPWMLAALIGSDVPTSLRLAESLMRERLVERVSEDSDEAPQFRIHEQVLAYARVRLRVETPHSDQEASARRLAEARLRRQERVPAQRLRKKVFTLQDRGKFIEALDVARDALTLSRMKGDKEGHALALCALAELYLELGNLDEAREFSKTALHASGVTSHPRALRCLGKVRRRLRQIPDAEELLREAHDAARELRDEPEQIRVLRELAAAQAVGSDPHAALATGIEAIRICDQRPDGGIRLRAGVLWSVGSALLYMGDLDGADATFRDAERISIDQEQILWRAWIGQGRSRVAMETRRYSEAKGFAEQALEGFLEMRHRYGVAHCRLLLGDIYRAQQQWEDAARILEEALETFQNCGDPWMTALAMHTLARNNLDQGHVSDATSLLETAYEIFDSVADDTNRLRVRAELASSVVLRSRFARLGERIGGALTSGRSFN